MPIVKCPVCGKEYSVRPGFIRVGRGKFCSRECAAKGRRIDRTTNCLNCGKEFKARNGVQKCCSRACGASYLHAKRKEKIPKTFGEFPYKMPSDESVTPIMMCPVW